MLTELTPESVANNLIEEFTESKQEITAYDIDEAISGVYYELWSEHQNNENILEELENEYYEYDEICRILEAKGFTLNFNWKEMDHNDWLKISNE